MKRIKFKLIKTLARLLIVLGIMMTLSWIVKEAYIGTWAVGLIVSAVGVIYLAHRSEVDRLQTTIRDLKGLRSDSSEGSTKA